MVFIFVHVCFEIGQANYRYSIKFLTTLLQIVVCAISRNLVRPHACKEWGRLFSPQSRKIKFCLWILRYSSEKLPATQPPSIILIVICL